MTNSTYPRQTSRMQRHLCLTAGLRDHLGEAPPVREMGIPPFGVPSHLLVANYQTKTFRTTTQHPGSFGDCSTDSGRLRQVKSVNFTGSSRTLQSIFADAGCIPG